MGRGLPRIDYADRLRHVKDLADSERYSACVRECGATFENGLRELLQELLESIEAVVTRDEILSKERAIGGGARTYRKLGLKELIALYEAAKIWDRLKAHLNTRFNFAKEIDWSSVRELRNISAHEGRETDEFEALQMAHWLKLFLYKSCLISTQSIPVAVPQRSAAIPRPDNCPECRSPITGDWRFCPICGMCVHLICAGCGRDLVPNFKICPYCETRVRGVTSVSANAMHQYELLFRGAFLDMYVNSHEREMLEEKRLELGLTRDQAEEIEHRSVPANVLMYQQLLEGIYLDGTITPAERTFLDLQIVKLKLSPKTARLIERAAKRSREAET